MKLYRRDWHSVFALVMALTGCKDNRTSKNGDSAVISADLSAHIAGSVSGTGWDTVAGSIMVLAASKSSIDAVVVLPGLTDSTLAGTSHFELHGLANVPLDLFSAKGLVGSSMLQISSQSNDSTGCVSWPTGKVIGSVPAGWKVALEKGKAIGLPLDSMEGMTGVDSTQFAAEVVSLALSLTGSADVVFSGIPFFARNGYRLTTPSASIIIAEAVRRINEEANPREEHLLLLAERSKSNEVYRVSFHARSAGAEESIETSEVLAALRLMKTNRLAIVITFDYEDGGKIGLLERVAANDWQVIWKSAYTGC